ncbi:MAG: hypothetical protein M4579_005521 [Chaenotheca gracillima]|nr:MAG: hypothetical protein M4579_005521 [Chaenotheca gracillima]
MSTLPMEFKTTPLFGGAMTANLPSNFSDVSKIRQIPDHQEVYLDNDGLTSIIFEINERVDASVVGSTSDEDAVRYHLDDVIEAEDDGKREEGIRIVSLKAETGEKLPPNTPTYTITATQKNPPTNTAGVIPDFIVVILTVIRLASKQTDLLITLNVPHASGMYDRFAVDLSKDKLDGSLPMPQAERIREEILKSFEILEWGLFDG